MSAECPLCHDTGFELHTAADGAVTAARCACRRTERGSQLLLLAGIPRRYDHCEFDTFEPHDPTHEVAKRQAREWVTAWPAVRHGLLFVGPPGTGKTHLAVAIARELVRAHGARVRFREQRELFKTLQSTFDDSSIQREVEVLAPLLGADVLILDDVGASRTTAWGRDVLHDVIAVRYNDELPLILTTNLELGEDAAGGRRSPRAPEAALTLQERLGDALMSRLYEMCHIVKVAGKDYRSWILRAKPSP